MVNAKKLDKHEKNTIKNFYVKISRLSKEAELIQQLLLKKKDHKATAIPIQVISLQKSIEKYMKANYALDLEPQSKAQVEKSGRKQQIDRKKESFISRNKK